jgi:hypothetical protein
MKYLLGWLCLLVAWPAAAQRDFLTGEEVDQIREAQEPAPRLKLYLKFAEQRLGMLQQLFAKEKPGRSALIHETFEDFTKIIEAMDMVVDDALKRKVEVKEGMDTMAAAEKRMLVTLQKLDETPAKDRQRYEFALKQAIETTKDSLDMSLEDLNQRRSEVSAKEDRERKERESVMQPKELAEKRAAEKADETKKKKAPTLRRKGEVVPPQNQ